MFRCTRGAVHSAAPLVLLVALAAAAPAAVLASTASLITVKVPAGQTVASLRYQAFVQTASCSRPCDLTTVVSISLSDAKRLGFKGAAPPSGRVTVASSYVRLKANTPTQVRFVVSATGKKLLSKVRGRLRVAGKLTAIPRSSPTTHVGASWQATLK